MAILRRQAHTDTKSGSRRRIGTQVAARTNDGTVRRRQRTTAAADRTPDHDDGTTTEPTAGPVVARGLSRDQVMPRSRWGQLSGAYGIRERPMETSTRQAEALNPALVATHEPLAGPLTGVDLDTGTPITTGPHELYAQGRISAPNVVVMGDVGTAKSSLVKTVYVARPIACGKQVAVFDRKNQEGRGEYHDVSALCGGTTVQFSRRGGAAINLLDPRISTSSVDDEDNPRVGQDRLLEMVAEFAHGPLTATEHHALRAAHASALARARAEGRTANIRDVVEAMYTPDAAAIPHPDLAERRLVDVDEVTRWGMNLAMNLTRFIDGDLSGLIDADTSDDVDWNARLLVFDTSGLDEGSPALALIMSVVSTFLSSVWSATQGQRIIVLEEGYTAAKLHHPGITDAASILRSLVKRGRGIGLAFVTVLHHVSDLPPESDAMSLIREAQVVHVMRQSRDDDRETVRRVFGFPAWTDDLLASLETGHHLLRIGSAPARWVQHHRTPVEEGVTNTDAAMHGQARPTQPVAPGADLEEI